MDLRTDEGLLLDLVEENVLSFLDHPPMIAWFIRFGTAIFGDTNFRRQVCRRAGHAGPTQLLLADMVRRVTHDVRAVVIAVLMPEAALYYGLLMAKVAPDVALIPFAVAMVWALVRLNESGDGRWCWQPGCSQGWRCSRSSLCHDAASGSGIHAGAGLAPAAGCSALIRGRRP